MYIIRRVVLPNTLTSMALDTFIGCENLEEIVVPTKKMQEWLTDNISTALENSKNVKITLDLKERSK